MGQCHYCHFTLSLEVQRKQRLCPKCASDIHCCLNCIHFDESTHAKCNEPDAPYVRDRAHQNHCPLFEFRPRAQPTSTNQEDNSEAERAKEAFKALFRGL